MPFRKHITDGIRFLLTHTNSDGGIPAVNLGDPSGCWTTAEAIEILICSPHLPSGNINDIKELIEFLLDQHIPGKGWPMSVGRKEISSMATGHSIAALTEGERIFSNDIGLIEKSGKARTDGLKWLHDNRNPKEGWGPEPVTPEGKESRIISTCYALRGYFGVGRTYDNSNDVKEAINYLVGIVNPDDGWGTRKGNPSDPANTARVVCTLLKSGSYNTEDPIIIKGLSYILDSKSMWIYEIESYVVSSAPGQVYFHANTLIDVLEALVRCNHYGKEFNALTDFFIETQETDGHWYLRDFEKVDKSITTWTTSEAIGALGSAHEKYSEKKRYKVEPPKKIWMIVLIVLGSVCVLEFLYILNVQSVIYDWWIGLSEKWQQVIIGAIIIGLIVGIIGNFLYDKLKNAFKKLENTPFRRKK